MSEEMVVKYCAPTLASIKTGNMFTCRFESNAEMQEYVRGLNRRLRDKGLRVLPLRYRDGKGLVYLYRPGMLSRDLGNETARRLLCDCGYDCTHTGKCLACLYRRLREQDGFPHEIGLFLGYPPEDVEGFIECREPKCSGCWKVYGNEDAARRTFAKYKKCTDVYLRCLAEGRGLEKLTVAKQRKPAV